MEHRTSWQGRHDENNDSLRFHGNFREKERQPRSCFVNIHKDQIPLSIRYLYLCNIVREDVTLQPLLFIALTIYLSQKEVCARARILPNQAKRAYNHNSFQVYARNYNSSQAYAQRAGS